MNTPDIVAAIEPIAALFDRLGVGYSVVGSVASSAHGVARATLDVDVVADLPARLVDDLFEALQADYYVDRDAVSDAVKRHAMFNVIHLETMLKVDIYVLGDRPFDRQSFSRRMPMPLEERPDARIYRVDTAEDTIVHKLEWFRAGGEVSERQWGDLLGILKVQGGGLDLRYVHRWCADLGLGDLLERALGEAGMEATETLFRPVGQAELDLIAQSEYRSFPPRLAGQPIFYPVLDEDYAVEIARDWNTRDAASGFTGYVTRFRVRRAFTDRYDVHVVGSRRHRELWIPAEDLAELNENIVGPIEVIGTFRGEQP
jgi:hypothetical protein